MTKKKRKKNTPVVYSYDATLDVNQYPMSCFLGIVGPLKYDPKTKQYSLSRADISRVTETMSAMDVKSGVSRVRAKKKQKKQENYIKDDLNGADASRAVVQRSKGKRSATKANNNLGKP